MNAQIWPLTLKQALHVFHSVGGCDEGRRARGQGQEADALQPAFWDVYAMKVFFSLKAFKKAGG